MSSEDSELYEVQGIVGYSRSRNEFRVKWSDLPCGADEWQPAPHIECHCEEMVKQFKSQKRIALDSPIEEFDSDHGDWKHFEANDVVEGVACARGDVAKDTSSKQSRKSAKQEARPDCQRKKRRSAAKLLYFGNGDSSELTSMDEEDSDVDNYEPGEAMGESQQAQRGESIQVASSPSGPSERTRDSPLPKCHRVRNEHHTHPMCSLASRSQSKPKITKRSSAQGTSNGADDGVQDATNRDAKLAPSTVATVRIGGKSADFHFAGLVPKAPEEQRDRHCELLPADKAHLLKTMSLWFMEGGPFEGLNRWAHLQKTAGVPLEAAKKAQGETVRTVMTRLLTSAVMWTAAGSTSANLSSKTGRVSLLQLARMYEEVYRLWRGKGSSTHTPDWRAMALERNLSCEPDQGASRGNERLRQVAERTVVAVLKAVAGVGLQAKS
ncbi:Chromo domain/shadow [Ceraceosorus bombacis]|uniref:Chromo domain/shadow n=1 Tax=Ceraceosorus bombacis TaxID=401625 RepID=A0A0P1BP83_9BASI|nr:Chromo domain/shadow [Ceraceosorus bombacis]